MLRGPHVSVVGLCSESQSQGDHDGQTKGVYDGPLQVPRTKASSMIALISLGGPTQLVPECEGHHGTRTVRPWSESAPRRPAVSPSSPFSFITPMQPPRRLCEKLSCDLHAASAEPQTCRQRDRRARASHRAASSSTVEIQVGTAAGRGGLGRGVQRDSEPNAHAPQLALRRRRARRLGRGSAGARRRRPLARAHSLRLSDAIGRTAPP
jgi:hypothetical protein